jgi:thioredoxin-related protein
MAIDRRTVLAMGVAAGGMALLGTPALAMKEPPIGENGLHVQDWFLESFLDLADDQAEAAEQGKHLVVLFEQRGCPYCRELHRVNLADPDIRDYMQKNFAVVQLDMWGSRAVTDFDGKEMEERELARRWALNFTPTLVFFSLEPPKEKTSGDKVAAAIMPGYLKPFHFKSFLEFVKDGGYKTESFQRFLQHKFERLQKQGIKPKVW